MTALRCTQKLLTAMEATPSAPPATGANLLGDWSLNLLHTRPKLVVAVSEHDRLVLEAAPYATLPQRFVESLIAINARLANYIVSINGKLEFPKEFALKRLTAQGA